MYKNITPLIKAKYQHLYELIPRLRFQTASEIVSLCPDKPPHPIMNKPYFNLTSDSIFENITQGEFIFII